MRRPSILFINRVYPPSRGASGRIVQDLAHGFARAGWHVSVVTTGLAAPFFFSTKTEVEWDGAVKIIRIKGAERPAHGLSYIRIWVCLLLAALRQPRSDIVVSMTDPPLLVLAGHIVSLLRKNSHIHWCQDLYPDLFPVLGVRMPRFCMKMLQGLSLRAMKRARKIIVIGRCMAERLIGAGLDAKDITFIPNWPDTELSPSATPENFPVASSEDEKGTYDDIANAFRTHTDQIKHGPKFRVLYAGNIGRAHPVDTILAAAEILNAQHPEIEFVFVGDGPRHTALVQERMRRGLDNIRLLPYQPAARLRDLMESGDVHLVSMKEEAAGLLVPVKLYAAMAVHRPCIFIGPQNSETAGIVQEFKCGVVVPQGDGAKLAEEIRALRLSGEAWFAAHQNAQEAAAVFMPESSINAWTKRAHAIFKNQQA